MLEDYEESISLTLRTWSSRKSLKICSKEIGNTNGSRYALQDEQEAQEWGDQSKFACILEVSESTRPRMEESLPNYHEDHIAGRGDTSLQHYNLVHKFIPMPQALKIPAAKAAVDKE